MSLTDEYNMALMEIRQGLCCKGEFCNGWILTDFDTWEKCSCGQGTVRNHPDFIEEEDAHVACD